MMKFGKKIEEMCKRDVAAEAATFRYELKQEADLKAQPKPKAYRMELKGVVEISNFVLSGLDALADIHPIIKVAVSAFRGVVNLEITRQENNDKLDAISVQMSDLMCVLFQLSPDATGSEMLAQTKEPEWKPTSLHLGRVITDIAAQIELFGTACDVYEGKSITTKLFMAVPFREWFANSASKLSGLRQRLLLAITSYTTVNNETKMRELLQRADGIENLIKESFYNMNKYLQHFASEHEQRISNFIEESGGQKKCLEDQNLRNLLEIISGVHYGKATVPKEFSNVASQLVLSQDEKALKEMLNKELEKDLGSVILKHHMQFLRMAYECLKLQEQDKIILEIRSIPSLDVSHPNRALINDYAYHKALDQVEHLPSLTTSLSGDAPRDPKLVDIVKYFAELEEKRLRRRLQRISYDISSANVRSLIGSRRIERVSVSIRWFIYMPGYNIQSLPIIFTVFSKRYRDLENMFKQMRLDPKLQFGKFAFGMFRICSEKPNPELMFSFEDHFDILFEEEEDNYFLSEDNETAHDGITPPTIKITMEDEDEEVKEPQENLPIFPRKGVDFEWEQLPKKVVETEDTRESLSSIAGMWTGHCLLQDNPKIAFQGYFYCQIYPFEGTNFSGRDGAFEFTWSYTSKNIQIYHARPARDGRRMDLPWISKGGRWFLQGDDDIWERSGPCRFRRVSPEAYRFRTLLCMEDFKFDWTSEDWILGLDLLGGSNGRDPPEICVLPDPRPISCKEGSLWYFIRSAVLSGKPSWALLNDTLTWKRSKRRWLFACATIFYSIFQAWLPKQFIRARTVERKMWIELTLLRQYDKISWWSAGPEIHGSKLDDLWALRRLVLPAQGRVYDAISDHLTKTQDIEKIFHVGTVVCDYCGRDIIKTRLHCIICVTDALDNQIDICNHCIDGGEERPVSNRNFSHNSSHSLVRHDRPIYRTAMLKLLPQARSLSAEIKEALTASEEISAMKNNAGATKSRWNDEEDMEKHVKDSKLQCNSCFEIITAPCWACLICPGKIVVCQKCEYEAFRTENEMLPWHGEGHSVLRINDNKNVNVYINNDPIQRAQVLLESTEKNAERAGLLLESIENKLGDFVTSTSTGTNTGLEERLERMEKRYESLEEKLSKILDILQHPTHISSM
ncbi:hypothetical protein M422DRAFT_255733 [Sphaerobolus stellatus SS14]|uniref:ZZ-type domain-containing protein n=1 Tax=Sphaerobolus stellatus (strain SS14) TaxID=990650 RepID=A0A0C9UDU6_SPHS4|nr:hypothetical protein M422DRAFT_255733 [Sphaerobolus stellatus SS14]